MDETRFRLIHYKQSDEFFIYDNESFFAYFVRDEGQRARLRSEFEELLIVSDDPPFERLSIRVTGRCNMACSHCYLTSQLSSEDLSLSVLQGAFDNICRLGALTVSLSGGEPLLHPDITDIVKEASKRKLVTNLETNGLLLTEEKARSLKSAGLGLLAVSLDGFSEESYEMRGKPFFS